MKYNFLNLKKVDINLNISQKTLIDLAMESRDRNYERIQKNVSKLNAYKFREKKRLQTVSDIIDKLKKFSYEQEKRILLDTLEQLLHPEGVNILEDWVELQDSIKEDLVKNGFKPYFDFRLQLITNRNKDKAENLLLHILDNDKDYVCDKIKIDLLETFDLKELGIKSKIIEKLSSF